MSSSKYYDLVFYYVPDAEEYSIELHTEPFDHKWEWIEYLMGSFEYEDIIKNLWHLISLSIIREPKDVSDADIILCVKYEIFNYIDTINRTKEYRKGHKAIVIRYLENYLINLIDGGFKRNQIPEAWVSRHETPADTGGSLTKPRIAEPGNIKLMYIMYEEILISANIPTYIISSFIGILYSSSFTKKMFVGVCKSHLQEKVDARFNAETLKDYIKKAFKVSIEKKRQLRIWCKPLLLQLEKTFQPHIDLDSYKPEYKMSEELFNIIVEFVNKDLKFQIIPENFKTLFNIEQGYNEEQIRKESKYLHSQITKLTS